MYLGLGNVVRTGVLLAAAVVPGCVSDDHSFVRDPPYSWGLVNSSTKDLSSYTCVTYAVRGLTVYGDSGALYPGTKRSADGGYGPIPDTVHVRWVEQATGIARDADVPVHGHIADEEHFTGTLWMVITDDGVTLRPEVNKWYGLKVDLQRFTR